MRVFKRKRRRGKGGRLQKSPKWYVEFHDHRGINHRLAGFPDRQATISLGHKLERLAGLRFEEGRPLDVKAMEWLRLDTLPRPVIEKLADWGIVQEEWAAGVRSIKHHIDAWASALSAKGDTERYIGMQASRVRRTCEGCGFRLAREIEGGKIEAWLHKQVEAGAFGLATRNHYLTAMKGFCRWMEREGHLTQDPTRHLRRVKNGPDMRRERRALTVEECRTLLEVTARSGNHHGMTGGDRALLYRLALETGLRYADLRSLKVGNLDLEGEPPSVRVEAAYTKNRREDRLPLRKETAAALRKRTRFMHPEAPLFKMWQNRGSEMLRRDLRAAGVPYRDSQGRVVDFHALRHTFVSNLARSGVHPKTAQDLARHSTITLTMDTYTHVLQEHKARALEQLPDLTSPGDSERLESA